MKSKRSRSSSKDGDAKSPIPNKRKKRSRSSSQDTPSVAATASKGECPAKQEDVVHHVSKFLESKEASHSVLFLVKHVESTEPSTEEQNRSEVTITKQDIATLLLPWSVARLIRAAADTTSNEETLVDMELVWRTLSCCLSTLTANTNASESMIYETTLSNSLSQSTLAKLIRAAASSTFGGECSTKLQMQMYASNCYLKLVGRYRPSFEVASNTLLKHVEDLVYAETFDDAMKVLLPKHQYNVVCGALRTIHVVLGGANVKRSFGILSSEEMLLRLGRLGFVNVIESSVSDSEVVVDQKKIDNAKDLVENIVRDGLLHQTHHMDGFCTMEELRCLPSYSNEEDATGKEAMDKKPKSGGKTCYQSGLFKSIRILLSETDSKHLVPICNLLPLLIHGFFDHVQKKQEKNIRSGVAVSTEADAKLQFHFWGHATVTAFERLCASTTSARDGIAVLKLTSDTLKMLLDYDVYSPSYSDPDEALVSFLKFVTRGILRCVETNDSASSSYILSVRTLLLLNHRLLNEQLSKYVAFTCKSLHKCADDERACLDASEVLATIVKTYSELRQMGHFLSATRTAFVDMKSFHCNVEMMNSLFVPKKVVDILSESYRTLPSGQLHELWDFFDQWITEIEERVLSEKDCAMSSQWTELSFAVRMFILYIKSIRADKHNSSELRNLCEKTITSAVAKLLDTSKSSRDAFLRYGIDLCGWLVDLHTRSCFWIDSIDVDGDGSAFLLSQSSNDSNTLNVLSYLHDEAVNTVESNKFKQWRTTLEQDAYNQQAPLSIDLDENTSFSLQPALLRLAMHRIHQLHSMIYYCKVNEHEGGEVSKSQKYASSKELKQEAKLLVNYVIYTAQMCSGLEPESLWPTVAQSLSTWSQYAEIFHMKVFLSWFFSTLSQASADTSQQDTDSVLALVRDASFYEVGEGTSLLIQEGLMFVLDKVLYCLRECSGSNDLPALNNFITSKCTADSSMTLVAQIEHSSLSINESIYATLNGAAAVVSFISSAPLDIPPCNKNVGMFDQAVGLDILVSKMYQKMIATKGSVGNALLKILVGTRCLEATLLPRITLSSNKNDSSLIMLTARHSMTVLDFGEYSEVALAATGDVLSEIFSLCIDYHDRHDSLMKKFLHIMNDVIQGDISNDATAVIAARACLIKSVVRKMNVLHRRHMLEKMAHQLCVDVVLRCQKNTRSCIIRQIGSRTSSSSDSKAAAILLLLASELLAFLGNESSGLNTCDIDELSEQVNELFGLVSNITDSANDSELKAAVYQTILSAMEQSESVLLEASLYSILRESAVDDIKFVVDYLSTRRNSVRPNYVFIVKIYQLLIHCVKSQEQITYLSNQSMRILLTSMSLLHDSSNEKKSSAQNITLFSSTMSSLVQRKDLLLLSGREISMVCSGMSSLFKDRRNDDTDAHCQVTIFKSCCSVISSLVTNYPKQFYSCPNPLFGLLLAMLDHILHSDSKTGLSTKALEYAK
jgi:hypothetical protein